jgi:Leucine-rich repeat (LRR) protein
MVPSEDNSILIDELSITNFTFNYPISQQYAYLFSHVKTLSMVYNGSMWRCHQGDIKQTMRHFFALNSNIEQISVRMSRDTLKLVKEFFENIEAVKLRKIKSIKMADTNLMLNNGGFEIFENLEELSVNFNFNDCSVESTALTGLRKLNKLNLSENRLTSLDKYAFASLASLTSLDLSGNRIKRVNESTFRGLVNLQEMNLSKNCIEFIEERSFIDLKNLVRLDLGFNSVMFLTGDVFSGLVSLEALILKHNTICTIERKALDALPKLSILDLNQNKFGYFDILEIFRNKTHLVVFL